jgi:D-3-phosphoglycerate dehydrogenase
VRILASDPVAEKGLNILREEGFIVDEKIKLSEEELIKIIPQ